MTITYSFTPNNTIRIHCGGDTLEVPLPPRTPDSITSSKNIGDGAQSFRPDMPIPPTVGRPRVTPTVIGIFTTNNLDIDDFAHILGHASVNTPDAVISFREIELTPSNVLEQRINSVRGTMLYGEHNCFILDVSIDRNRLPTKAQLSTLENILRNSQNQLQGIRLVEVPDA